MKIRRMFGALIFILAVVGPATLYAQTAPIAARAISTPLPAPAVDPVAQPVRLLMGRSTVVDTDGPIARVSLTSADIADAVVTSQAQLLLHGKAPGTISMFVWERGGAIRRYEISVQRDLEKLEQQIHDIFPKEKIDVRANGKNVIVSGYASSKDVMDKVTSLAGGFVESKDEVVSLLQIAPNGPSNQVLLKVRFAEVSRTALTELAAQGFANGYKDGRWFGRSTTEQFPAPAWTTPPLNSGRLTIIDYLNLFLFDSKNEVGGMIRAMQQRGTFQSLAEPNLVAESGKEASFLAGGEYPVPVPQPGAGGTAITIAYKEYGVRLNFTPVVNGNRVHLKVRPEVSTLDFGNAIQLEGFKIPALSTRRTETELELDNGQTFAVSGLLNNQMSQTLSKIPGIGDIPILGYLFKSKQAQKDQTELVVMITPEILPLNSPGVTTELPRTPDKFLPPLEQKKSFAPQAPAFPTPSGGRSASDEVIPEPQAAAAAVNALSTGTRGSNVHVDATGSAPAAASTPAAASVAAAKGDPSRAPKQSEEDKKKLKADQERQAKLAKEQAVRDAEAAKKAHEMDLRKAAADRELAKKQAERDRENAKKEAEAARKRDKAVADAQAKIKAAEGVYKQETGKSSTEQQQQQQPQQQQ